jgi:hypothetical protein
MIEHVSPIELVREQSAPMYRCVPSMPKLYRTHNKRSYRLCLSAHAHLLVYAFHRRSLFHRIHRRVHRVSRLSVRLSLLLLIITIEDIRRTSHT